MLSLQEVCELVTSEVQKARKGERGKITQSYKGSEVNSQYVLEAFKVLGFQEEQFENLFYDPNDTEFVRKKTDQSNLMEIGKETLEILSHFPIKYDILTNSEGIIVFYGRCFSRPDYKSHILFKIIDKNKLQ